MKYMFFIFFETKRLIKHDIARGKPSRWLKRDFPIVLAIPNQKCFEFPHKALARSHCCRHKCFPVFPRAQHLLPTQILCPGHKKMFLIFSRNILCPQQMFPSLRSMETQDLFCVPRICAFKKHHGQQCVRNNVSSFARVHKMTLSC